MSFTQSHPLFDINILMEAEPSVLSREVSFLHLVLFTYVQFPYIAIPSNT